MAKSKLNSIETLVSQALINMQIRHEEFVTNLRERHKYEKTEGNLKTVCEDMRLNSINSKKSKFVINLRNL